MLFYKKTENHSGNKESKITPQKIKLFIFNFKNMQCLIVILFCLSIVTIYSSMMFKAHKTKYYNPKLNDLTISSGIITFTDRWRNTGGHIKLITDDYNYIYIDCGGPYYKSSCYNYKKNNTNINLKSTLTNERATIWWYKTDEYKNYGRLYQIKIKDNIIVKYEDRFDDYELEYKKGPPDYTVYIIYGIIATCIAIILSTRKEK